VAVAVPHPPVKVTVYGNEPEAVGVPLIVTTFAAHTPDTPAGKPVTVAPVAVVVANVILVIKVLIHLDWLFVPAPELNVIVLFGVTMMVPVALTDPHPPVNGML
jgi:hypothetical protein